MEFTIEELEQYILDYTNMSSIEELENYFSDTSYMIHTAEAVIKFIKDNK